MKFKVVSLIVFLVYLYLPIDTINGVLIRNQDISISPVYKVLILLLMLYYLIKNKIYAPLKWVLFFFVIFIIHVVMDIFTSIDFFWGLKFLAIIISFHFFKKLIIDGHIDIVKKLAFISFAIIALNVIIGVSGYGYAQYARNDIGTRGLFYAGNELGVLLLITSIIILTHYLKKKNNIKYLFFSLLFILFGAMLATKTAVLGQILVVSLLPVINFFQTSNGFIVKKRSLKLVAIGSITLLMGIPYLINYVLYEMNLMARLSYWSEKVDMITLFFSGRNLLAADVLNYWKSHSNTFNNLFGYGYDELLHSAGRSVEIDAIDLFMVFGIVSVLAMYGFFIDQYFKGSKLNSKEFIYRPYVRFGILFLLVLSCMSGHVLNSGMAGLLIGAFLSLQYYSKENYEG